MVAHEEGAEGDAGQRHDDADEGVAPAHLGHEGVVGDDGDLAGHHEAADDHEEEDVAAWKA